ALAGLRGDTWELKGDLDAKQTTGFEPAANADIQARDAGCQIDVRYARHGDLDIKKLAVMLPSFGIDLDVTGRLVRRSFGVLRPELAVKAKLDLDRLRTIAPAVGDAHGGVGFDLDVHGRNETSLDVFGMMSLDRFSYAKPGLALLDARGRVPVDQHFALPT